MSSVIALHPGAEFAGRYEVVRCIQLGGMGAVYEVVHRQTRRRRALKMMLPSVVESAELRERFKLEATVAAEVVSDHIVETFDAGIDEESGAPFLVMELLRGVELGDLVKSLGPLASGDVVALSRQVARGLDKTHAAGIVHRDLKPENVFITKRDDGSLCVKILDFGVAKVVTDVTHAAKTKVMGTPLYMAPEQLTGDGRIGPRADLYALGHLAFRLLVGRAYWKQEADASSSIFNFLLQVMDGHPESACERAATLGVRLPAPFDAWFDEATAREPADRFADGASQIDALAKALGVALDGDTTEAFAEAFEDALAVAGAGASLRVDATAASPMAPTQPSEPPVPEIGSPLTQQPLTRDPPPSSTRRRGTKGTSIGAAAVVLTVGAVGVVGMMGDETPGADGALPLPARVSGSASPSASSSAAVSVAPSRAPDEVAASNPSATTVSVASASAAPATKAPLLRAPPVAPRPPPTAASVAPPVPVPPPPPPAEVDPLKIR